MDAEEPAVQPPPPLPQDNVVGREGGYTTWKGLNEELTKEWVNGTYLETVGWPATNLFEPPKCAATGKIAKEMAALLNNFTQDTPYAPFALKALFLLPRLFFQKTHQKAKMSENVKAVKRRVDLWLDNKLDELLAEARAIQKRLPRLPRRVRQEDKARSFANDMRQGKISSALRALEAKQSGGVLPINRETINMLKEKHPPPSETEGLRLQGCQETPNRVIFDMITGEMVWKRALQTHGSAGPSGLDAKGWRRLMSSTYCGSAADDLCSALAALAKKLAATNCRHVDALTACRLIPLDKNPGCRPIGVGEVFRRIIGKCIMAVVKEDVRRAAGNLQVCAGQQAGAEAAIHAMREIFGQESCEAVLFVDANNAFNAINRKTMLHNINYRCPSLAKYAENTYKEPSDLYIVDNSRNRATVLQSMEGTTQGDPVAMAMYAIGLSVLQDEISYERTQVKQVAYADDLSGAGKISDLMKWWNLVNDKGPIIGYTPNAKKSVLIVKPELYDLALDIFRDSGVIITKEGQRHLGAVIGTEEFKKKYMEEKVNEWVKEVEVLADIAKTEPHAAYSAYTHGLQHRWSFVMRTIPGISTLLRPLENSIRNVFLPALLRSHALRDDERALLVLPPRLGGMGITSPEKLADIEHLNSIKLTLSLTEKIIAQDAQNEPDQVVITEQRRRISNDRQKAQKDTLESLKITLPWEMVRKIDIAQETGASNWLASLPLRAKGFALNKQEFLDGVALRYGWPVEGLPKTCACGKPNSVDHTMKCQKGGFVCIRHDEVRDLTASMLREVCNDVSTEPTLLPLDGEHFQYRTTNTTREARVDISARGFWTRGQKSFVDIRIFEPMAPSHLELNLEAAHRRNEQEKIRAYSERIQHVDHGSFTPLVFTTSGGMGPKAKCFYRKLAETLAEKKHQPRSHVVAWMRCRLSFSLLRSALLCLRGTRYSTPTPIDMSSLDYEATVVESRLDIDMAGCHSH